MIVDEASVASQTLTNAVHRDELFLVRVNHLRLPIRHSHAAQIVKLVQDLRLLRISNVDLLDENPDVNEPGVALLHSDVEQCVEAFA